MRPPVPVSLPLVVVPVVVVVIMSRSVLASLLSAIVLLLSFCIWIWFESESRRKRERDREREEVTEEEGKQCKLRLQSHSPCTAFPCPDAAPACLCPASLVVVILISYIWYMVFFSFPTRAVLRVHSTFIISKQINVAHMWHHFMRRVYLFYGIIISLAVWQGDSERERGGKGRSVSQG